MTYRIRSLKVLLFTLFLFPPLVQAQIPIVKAQPFMGIRDSKLSEKFKAYQALQISTSALVDIVRNENFNHRVRIDLPGYGNFAVELFENSVKAPNYLLTVKTEAGMTNRSGNGIVKTFRGNREGGQYVVSLTIDDGFISGFIQLPKGDLLQIEPLRRYINSVSDDAIIVYRESDVIQTRDRKCGVEHALHQFSRENSDPFQKSVVDECLGVEIAFANDWLMYEEFGEDIEEVENHNLTVINDVQNNYDNEFADELIFEVVQIWISTCSSCDPWTNSTDAEVLLADFTDWGPSGFSNTHDVANLWTHRDFMGQTVGLSWIGGVCSPFGYLTTQNSSSDAGTLRTLLAHELGHNFGSFHDGPGSTTIMAPTLTVSNSWSGFSIVMINEYVEDINCLGICAIEQMPLADFTSDGVIGCEPFTVNFFDDSFGPPTAWAWSFPGGTPSVSNLPNPTVEYQNFGIYDVILEVSNSLGTNTIVRTDYITVLTEPIADFSYDQMDLSLIFTDLSENASLYFWDFGDGFTSTEENPTHTYAQDGEYEVSLTVSNDCGEDEYDLVIEVFTLPIADFSFSVDFGCAPLIVQFQNESSENVQFVEWIFQGGTPSSSTEPNPLVTYSNPGLYDVTLIVENVIGFDELTIDALIEVIPDPVSDFDYLVNGLSVQFMNSAVDAESYLWLFGDGDTSTHANPNHTYLNGGSYTVTLIATNDCGSDSATTTVVLSSSPVAGFIASTSLGCLPLSVTYSSISIGVVTSFNWSFPGGSPMSSIEPNPTVIYNNAGAYDVQLIVGNTIGFDTVFQPDAVTIFGEVVAGFIVDIDSMTANFTNTSTGDTTNTWIIEGDVFGSEDVAYTFDEDGEYTVQLVASGPCGNDTTVQVIDISTIPTAGFASSTTSGCQPLTVQFFNTSSPNATTFSWVFEGGSPSTSIFENPVVEYLQPGIFDVQLNVWSESGMDTLVRNELIEVDALPVSQFSTIQTGLFIEFTNTSSHADQFFWMFGDDSTSSEINPDHIYSGFGSYQVTLLAINECGVDTTSFILLLSELPVPLFVAEQVNGCAPFEVQFLDMSQNNPVLWEWSFPGGLPDTSNLQNPTVVYDEPGFYQVGLRVSNTAGTQTLVRKEYIYVAFPPTAGFISAPAGGIVTFTNLSQNGVLYLWDFGDGTQDTSANPIHIYSMSGTYNVQLIAVNACSSDTISQDVLVNVTAVQNLDRNIDVRIFPNPNDGVFAIHIDDNEEFDMEVFDLLGRSMLKVHLTPVETESHQHELPHPNPGIYTVVIWKHDFKSVVKMVVL